MRYTVVFELEGPAAAAVAVEWTDVAAPVDSGMGWEPCHRLGGGRWRFASQDPEAARHGRDPGLFAGIGMRYRLTPDGPWSPVSASRKEIVIVAVTPLDLPPPALRAADWSALEPFELDGDVFTAAFTLQGTPAGAVAVDWTAAHVPGPGDWTPCAALGAGRWRLDGPGSTVGQGAGRAGIGIRYRLAAAWPASAVSEDRKAFTAPLLLVPPFLLAAPVLAGAGKIGQPVDLDPGLWGGTPVPGLAVRWLRNGTEIPGATGMTYLPGPADDRTQLRARVAATSPAGSLSAETAALAVTYVAPVAVGELFDEVFDQGTGPQELATAAAFAGAGLAFAATGAGASIDAATGLLSIPTDVAVDGAQVTVTATNSGGSATQSFLVTVEAAAPSIIWPPLSGTWSVVEIRDPSDPGAAGVSGHLRATFGSLNTAPTGFTLHHSLLADSPDYPANPTLPAVTANSTYVTNGVMAVGETCYPALWWKHTATGTFKRADTKPGFQILGLEVAQVPPPPPPSGFPLMPQSQVNDAIGKALTDFGPYNGAGTNSGFFGSSAVVIAAASFAGNSSADARLLQQLRYNIQGGHDPSGAGGFVAQHELRFVAAAALAKLTPRVWNLLSSTEKSKIDLVVKGLAAGAAYTSATNNFEIKANVNRIRSLRSTEVWWKGNPNFSIAAPGILLCARVYMGSASALTTFLNNFNKAAFAAELQAAGLSSLYESFRTTGSQSGSLGTRPTAAQVESAITNWTWARTGDSIGDHVALITRMTEYCFSKKVSAGLNDGAGIVVNGVARGRIINGASGLPNKGATGMAHELDTTDAEGKRSAMSYSMFGVRIVLDTLTVLAAAGLIDPGSSSIAGLKSRITVGMTDMKYKSDNGYRSYSHAGQSGPNEDWTAALRADQWGWSYTFGQWTHLLLPWFGGA